MKRTAYGFLGLLVFVAVTVWMTSHFAASPVKPNPQVTEAPFYTANSADTIDGADTKLFSYEETVRDLQEAADAIAVERNICLEALIDAASVGDPEVNAAIKKHMKALREASAKRAAIERKLARQP